MADCGDVKKVFVKGGATVEEAPAPIKGIGITDKAADKIKLFLTNDGKDTQTHGLRVCVKKDGCSGLSYDMALSEVAPAREAGDKIFEKEGAFLIVEKTSYFYLVGSQLDFTEALTGSGFALSNPNIKKTCSCGSSFAV